MATRHYESVVVINATLEDSQIEQTISNIQETIKVNGGEISDTESWGRKRLAYQINKAKSGYYLITRFIAQPSLISEFERALKLEDNVIKYLTIALDKKALEHLKAVAAQKNEKPASKEETVVQKDSNNENSNDKP